MKKIILTALLGILITSASAQSDIDALRYSQGDVSATTARALGLGGAIGAMGADQTAILVNPAGLAQYRSGSFNMTVSTANKQNESDYLSNSRRSNLFNGQFNSINLVNTQVKTYQGNPVKTGWVNTNWAIGYNRTQDYNRNVSYRGTSKNSYTDYVAQFVEGLDVSQLEVNDEQLSEGFYFMENMFWDGFLIDSISNGNYYAYYDNVAGNMSQSGNIVSRGSSGEFNLAFAGNYEHKLYFGASLNVHRVNYTETNVFSEVDNPNTTGNWNSFDLTRNLETRGTGYSGRLGVIFRPNKNIRIGGTMHTPSLLNLTDEYSDELAILYDDGTFRDLMTINKEFSYRVVTPAKYGLQGAYIFGKKGLISAEIETLDYSTMNISSDDDSFNETNETITDKYSNATTFKIGGEYAMNDFRLRGGFATMGSPFESGDDFRRNIVSGGIGFQDQAWAFDFGLSRELTSDVYVPYTVSGAESNIVNSNLRNTRIMLTLTTKF
jgi:hypothetical protein